KRYTVAAANDVPGRDPKNWQFQGSNDGSTWSTLDTQSNQTFPGRYQVNTYTVASPASYRYYRLNVTANNGDASGLQLSEFGLLTDTGRTIPDGTYRVASRYSNKIIKASSGGTANGTQLVQWSYDGGGDQKWTYTYLGNGQYKVTGVASGRVMDVSGNNNNNGSNLNLWDWVSANNQKWVINPIGDGCFKLVAVHSGKVADVAGPSTADGAAVHQWDYVGALNQQWSFSTAP
ncbi:MAG: RICIN domain-containing protein, partial [Luteolibacter sp.]